MDYSPRRTICIRSLIMALLFVVIGALTIYIQLWRVDDLTWRNWVRALSGCFLLIFGALMLRPRHRNIMSAIGLMCLGIGLSRALVSVSNVLNPSGFSGFDTTYFDLVMVIIGYVTMWFALYQIYRGANFLRGNAMNAFIMRFSSMAIVLGYIIVVLYACIYFKIDYRSLLEFRADFFTSPILYLMYFILLCSHEVFEQMEWEKVRSDILDVAVPLNPGLVAISCDECRRLKDSYGDPSKWVAVCDESPVERELRIRVSANNRPMEIVLRKWRGKDSIYLTLVPGNGAAFLASVHSVLESIEFDRDYVKLVGEKNPIMFLYSDDVRHKGFPEYDVGSAPGSGGAMQ